MFDDREREALGRREFSESTWEEEAGRDGTGGCDGNNREADDATTGEEEDATELESLRS